MIFFEEFTDLFRLFVSTRKVASKYPFCVLIYMNSYISHIYFILFIFSSTYLIVFIWSWRIFGDASVTIAQWRRARESTILCCAQVPGSIPAENLSTQISMNLSKYASGLPYYCAPLVCVSVVREWLDVWRHNKPKPKNIPSSKGSKLLFPFIKANKIKFWADT